MRSIAFVFCITLLAGCSTPNPNPGATAVVYEKFERGIKDKQIYSRQQVYTLLGQPYSVKPPGDIDHCRTATWKIPNDVSGWGHLTVIFSNDIAVNYETIYITGWGSKEVSLDEVLKMQPFDAVVEKVRVEHRWFFGPDVYISLKRNDNAKRLRLSITGATVLGLKLAAEFQKGNSYTFPSVITNFLDAQERTVKQGVENNHVP